MKASHTRPARLSRDNLGWHMRSIEPSTPGSHGKFLRNLPPRQTLCKDFVASGQGLSILVLSKIREFPACRAVWQQERLLGWVLVAPEVPSELGATAWFEAEMGQKSPKAKASKVQDHELAQLLPKSAPQVTAEVCQILGMCSA